jgi:hypothetical protein
VIPLGTLLAPRDWDAEPTCAGLRLKRYPFGEKDRTVPWGEIGEVCVGWFPPAVRLRSGEYVFVHATRVEALVSQAATHSVRFVARRDVWSLILDPFLDTEHGAEWDERLRQNLEAMGISREETQELRDALRDRMLALTSATWEWQHYGLFDALLVKRPATALGRAEFEAFCARAFALADRGSVEPSTPERLLALFPKRP